MDLQSRIVFLDTNIYQGKNFQFLTHSLGSLKKLVEDGEIHLLITDVTIGEVKSHISEKAGSAVSELKAIKKNAMILRNIPDVPAFGIFQDVTAACIENKLFSDFEKFLKDAEVVSIDGVLPSKIFSMYFSVEAPFALGEKRKEFADAFTLEALVSLSTKRALPIHVVTNDRDMHRYAESHPSLICSESIDELIDAVNRAVAIEPAAFATEALQFLRDGIISAVKDKVKDADFEISGSNWDAHIENIEIANFQLVAENLLSVDSESCIFDLEFEFSANTVEIIKDYDRSPFDHEDDRYHFVLENVATKSFDVVISAQATISYQDKLINTVDLSDLEVPYSIKLRNPYNEEHRELDINGD